MINAVTDTASGDLLRWGHGVDFTNDGKFNSESESIISNISQGLIVKKRNGGDYHRYNGSSFDLTIRTKFTPKNRKKIMREVIKAADDNNEDANGNTQRERLLDSLDVHTSVLAALDNENYLLASSRIEKALLNGEIEQADKDLVESFFPLGWN